MIRSTLKVIELFRSDLNKGSEGKKSEDISYYDFSSEVVTLIDIEQADVVIFLEKGSCYILKDKHNIIKQAKWKQQSNT